MGHVSVPPQAMLPGSGLPLSGELASNRVPASVTEVPPSDVPGPVPVPVGPLSDVESENKSEGLEPPQATRSTATRSEEEAKRMRMTSRASAMSGSEGKRFAREKPNRNES